MRFYDWPARYEREVRETLARLDASIRRDMQLSDGEEPWPNGFIPKDARVGRICILVGDLPADGAQLVFPQAEQLQQERIAS